MAMTPMMQQYLDMKKTYKDSLLFYRIGDFYEMFYDDAKTASRELSLTLTGRDCGEAERAPMCGVPHHACEAYIARLVKKGYKVAICEQMEDPAKAVGLVKRDIIRVVTPGTVMEDSMLEDKANNFIACLYLDAGKTVNSRSGAVCFADISTGEFFAYSARGRDTEERLRDEIARYDPREVLQNSQAGASPLLQRVLCDRLGLHPETRPEEEFDGPAAEERCRARFGKTEADESVIRAAGALLSYLTDTQRSAVEQINRLRLCDQDEYLVLDISARRNLELTETLRTREKKGTLLWVLDRTETAMGGRLLVRWVETPLTNPAAILRRLDAVEEMVQDTVGRRETARVLSEIYDMERLTGRIVYGSANARDLLCLRDALGKLPLLRERIAGKKSPLWRELYDRIDPLEDLRTRILEAIREEPQPPVTVHDGGIIRDGYDPEVDRLRKLLNGSAETIAEIEAREREATGIRNLKVSYNKVFGYFIEVSKSFLDKVPDTYIRKQTLTNCERFITQELKDLENEVFNAKDRINDLEYELYDQVRTFAAAHMLALQDTAAAVAQTDVLLSLAEVACENHYVRPDIDLSDTVRITDGRHPVVEKMLKGTRFVPNDALLDCRDNRVAVITGPNMAGKSTYMRQIALIVLMAQMGSFVPARQAKIGITDRIFTRIGASDDMAAGQSTFMVEMVEVADILREATAKSLIILDEIGRGTSTFDGMSIARAVLEYAADKKRIGARTVFATHYHELTALEALVDGVKNYNISVKKRGDDITFLRKIVRGGADDSFGIEVARLAGIPAPVIDRAKEVLRELTEGKSEVQPLTRARTESPEQQLGFGDPAKDELIEKLAGLEADTLTPIEALNLVYTLSAEAKKL